MFEKKPMMSEKDQEFVLGDMVEMPDYTKDDVDAEYAKITKEVKTLRNKWVFKILPALSLVMFLAVFGANYFLGAMGEAFSNGLVVNNFDFLISVIMTSIMCVLMPGMFCYMYSDLGRCFFFIKPRRDLAEMNVRMNKASPLLDEGKITHDQWFFYSAAVLTRSVTRF